jgi:hypothetical protein
MALTAEKMELAFSMLGVKAIEAGRVVDLAVYGGSALALAYDLRRTTKDVDAVYESDKDFIPKAVAAIAAELDLPEDWLNDAVKGYVSQNELGNLLKFASYPSESEVGLRVFVPAPEYFFAMKCIDIRLGAGSNDVEDVKKLALVCNIKDAEEALKIVESFYPEKRIPPKTSLALEEIFQALDTSQQLTAGRAGFDKELAQHKLDKQDGATKRPVPPLTR